ncbi:MAG: ATP-binding protein [Bacillota bacterium]|nr:ATP-binding protein [Bacillota bacterium]
MTSRPRSWFRPWTGDLSLPLRLALATAVLLAVVSLVVIVFVNVAFRMTVPEAIIIKRLEPPAGGQGGQVIEAPGAADRLITNRMRWTSTVGLLLMVPLGAAAAYWLSRQGLKPVRSLSNAIGDVNASRLTARVVVPKPDDDLKGLVVSVNGMLERLDEAFTRREDFVSNVAHELRTPLSTLRTTLEVTLANGTSGKEDYRETLVSMEVSLSRLEHLVEGLLLLAKRGLPSRTSVSLGPLLEEVQLDLESLAAQHQVALRLQGDLSVGVQGDPVLLHRAFFNLAENGIRYNRAGGKVTITLGCVDSWAMVVISDSGMGVPIEEQRYLFDRFYRADHTRSRFSKGAGLGLSIVKHVVDVHGGEVHMVSTPGEGTTFTVKLPLAAPEQQQSNNS